MRPHFHDLNPRLTHPDGPELSVVIPVRDEVDGLAALMARLVPVLDRTSDSWELLFVDDGSQDGSLAEMRRLRQQDPRIGIVELSRNFGHQLAITAGMDHVRGRAVIVMDADLQDPPEVLPQMVRHWRDGIDVVYGVRSERAAESTFKRWTAAAFYRLLASLSPIDIPVDSGDFRLMSRRAVDALRQMPERGRYVRGMVAWVGFRQIGVTFERDARVAGRTKYPPTRMIAFAADAMFSFSTVPLRLATTLGFTMALLAVLYFVRAAALKILLGTGIHGWTSLVAVVALIGSAQLVCLGIIGEYVGRVYEEVKRRPLYLVGGYAAPEAAKQVHDFRGTHTDTSERPR